jgi:choline dehydrogenase-like flavoprotein
MRVLVLEAGGVRRSPGGAVLDAEIVNPLRHDAIDDVMCAGLGGTSLAWSGRALPFDAIDFRAWPITIEELAPHYRAAADFLGCRDALSPPAPGAFAHLERFDASTAESFCDEPDLSRRLRASLSAADGPVIILNARVARLRVENGIVAGIEVRIGAEVRSVRAARIVIACGGLSSLRLLLLAQRETPSLFGGESGPLGRGYMGHLTGAVADMVLTNQEDADAFRAQPIDGVLARRQIRPRENTITREGIGSISFNALAGDGVESHALRRFTAARAAFRQCRAQTV